MERDEDRIICCYYCGEPFRVWENPQDHLRIRHPIRNFLQNSGCGISVAALLAAFGFAILYAVAGQPLVRNIGWGFGAMAVIVLLPALQASPPHSSVSEQAGR